MYDITFGFTFIDKGIQSKPSKTKHFLDAELVLRFIRQLGENNILSLKWISIKTAMLMALTQLLRLANLSQLNIGLRTYTTNGFSQLIYQNRVNHQTLLMKISFHSTLQTNHCIQLRPYRCIRIAQPLSELGNLSLPFFCHGLGNMNQSPAIPLLGAWLQTCLQEIGVDTDT